MSEASPQGLASNQGLPVVWQTTSFSWFQVQVTLVSADEVKYTLLPGVYELGGDTTGTTTVDDPKLVLPNVTLSLQKTPIGTVSGTFTTDFSAQSASASITSTVFGDNQFDFDGMVGFWQNSAAGSAREPQPAAASAV